MTELVRGEASESEDDIEKEKVFASEILGEATESDEEVYEKTIESPGTGRAYTNNILQKKLMENNLAIVKDLNNFVKNFITSASKQLLNTDQLLIKSQVSMQSVVSSLKSTQANMKQLHEKSGDILTANFIPSISSHK